MTSTEQLRPRLGAVADPLSLFEGLFAAAPVAFHLYRADGASLAVNQAFCDLFGAAPPADYNLFRDELLLQRGFAGVIKRTLSGETVRIPAHWYDLHPAEQRRRIGIEVTAFPLSAGPQGVTHFALCIKEVTAELQREADAASMDAAIHVMRESEDFMRLSENRMRLAYQAAGIGPFDWEVKTGTHSWSPELEAMHGLRRGEFQKNQRAWLQLIHPEDRDRARACVDRALTTLEPAEDEWRVVWPDGSIHWVLARMQALKDAHNQLDRVVGVNLDITARKQAELERQQAVARLRVLAETSRELAGLVSLGKERVLSAIAMRLGTMLGDACIIRLLDDDGRGFGSADAVYHVDPDVAARALELLEQMPQAIGEGVAGRAVQTGEPVVLPTADPEQMVATAAERFRPLVSLLHICGLVTVPFKNQDRVVGAISLIRSSPGRPFDEDDVRLAQDVAARAALALQNATLLSQLEERVSARTAELERANHELEAFSYSVSHDLRTPLRAIDGFSLALMTDYGPKLDEQGRHYLERVRKATQRMSGLIDDMLDLSRISRSPVTLKPVDLSALVESTAEDLRRAQPERKVKLNVEPNVRAYGDPKLLAIMFDNLLGNAWKFTSHRETAEVWFGRTSEGEYFVRDNGTGFDMAYADKLFAPFSRLHRDSEFEGTGVGLATVQRVVTRHHGTIRAQAAVGQGATFFFTLGD